MSLYETLGVEPGCSESDLRAAFRARARELHPDTASGRDPMTGGGTDHTEGGVAPMAELNAAWKELSNPETRRRYDQSLAGLASVAETVDVPQPAPQSSWTRRQAWVAGVQAQIIRLGSLAGRSATQTLLLRTARATRADYEGVVSHIVHGLSVDTESRVRAARAAGAAPLDLGVAATLIGVRCMADQLRRDLGTAPSRSNVTSIEAIMQGELLDRMWDILAHELPTPLELALGGNPHVARLLSGAA